jgi:hypothetical protein
MKILVPFLHNTCLDVHFLLHIRACSVEKVIYNFTADTTLQREQQFVEYSP